jgi:hypothetical protein
VDFLHWPKNGDVLITHRQVFARDKRP